MADHCPHGVISGDICDECLAGAVKIMLSRSRLDYYDYPQDARKPPPKGISRYFNDILDPPVD